MNPLKAAIRYYKLRASWLGEGGLPVSQELADKRATICTTCAFNNPARPIWEGIAESVTSLMGVKAEMNLHAEHESNLHICDKCDCFLPLKVWVPLDHVKTAADKETLPPWCWVREEASQ